MAEASEYEVSQVLAQRYRVMQRLERVALSSVKVARDALGELEKMSGSDGGDIGWVGEGTEEVRWQLDAADSAAGKWLLDPVLSAEDEVLRAAVDGAREALRDFEGDAAAFSSESWHAGRLAAVLRSLLSALDGGQESE